MSTASSPTAATSSSSKPASVATPSQPPSYRVRWLHAATGLDLHTAPVQGSSSVVWAAFSSKESDRLEAAYQLLPLSAPSRQPAPRRRPKQRSGSRSSFLRPKSSQSSLRSAFSATPADKIVHGNAATEAEQEQREREEERKCGPGEGVPVGLDGLFEVDVARMELYPAFWTLPPSQPRPTVMRCTWMYTPDKPCEPDLAEELEEAYVSIRPWEESYPAELAAATSVGQAALDKLRVPVTTLGSNGTVLFEDAHSARVFSGSLPSRLSTTLWSSLSGSFRASSSTTASSSRLAGGVPVYRGYSFAVSHSSSPQPPSNPQQPRSRRGSAASASGNGGRPRKSSTSVVASAIDTTTGEAEVLVEGGEELGEEEDPSAREVDDLVLIVHGIGQQLASSWEAFNFTYAVNLLRAGAVKQSTANPALSSVVREHTTQYLPVQWRASIGLGDEDKDEDEEEGGRFTVEDITPGGIPLIRDLENKVLLDIPLYMSRHKEKMVKAVCKEANRIYRLWVDRHPEFPQTGRVHIIAHSLGAALSTDILSVQPTHVPAALPPPGDPIEETRFLFDTSRLFLLGSPLGVFLHLESKGIVPRRGRERTTEDEEAVEGEGRYGCLAADCLYNIFYTLDPVAFLLNPTVSASFAHSRPPKNLPDLTPGFHTPRPLPAPEPSEPSTNGGLLGGLLGGGEARPKLGRRVTSGLELSWEGDTAERRMGGTKAERRLDALNPHGNLDFAISHTGLGSEYMAALTAHAEYWADERLAAFILTELYATEEDRRRIGI